MNTVIIGSKVFALFVASTKENKINGRWPQLSLQWRECIICKYEKEAFDTEW